MCPICWATLLATFSTSIGTSAAIMAWRDRWTLSLALGLLALAGVHQFGITLVPWWAFAGAMASLIVRIAWVVLMQRDKLSVFAAWRKATAFAAARCPKRRRNAADECSLDGSVSSSTTRQPQPT